MERNRFKQRIVGSLVLVALGAIVIPFLLDIHPGEEWWGDGNIPKKPANGFVTRVLPLDEWSKQVQNDMAEGAKQLDAISTHEPAAIDAEQSNPSNPPQTLVPNSGATPPPQPSVSTQVLSTTKTSPVSESGDVEGWVVQLGSFSNQTNADELSEKLRKSAYHVFVEKITQGNQTVYRVRIGPVRQRADAEAIRNNLAHELQLDGMVMHVP